MNDEDLIKRLDKLEEDIFNLGTLYTAMAERIDEIHDKIFQQKRDNATIISVFKNHFGSSATYKFRNHMMTVDTDTTSFNIDEINSRLGVRGYSASFIELKRLFNQRNTIRLSFKINKR